MIPSSSMGVIRNQRRVIEFDQTLVYKVEGVLLHDLEALMRRLGTETRMNADEMRDWMNRLHAGLRQVESMNRELAE